MDEHTLVAVLLADDGPVFGCRCGHIASGVTPGIWTVTLSADGTRASFQPSVNWPGHFHAYFRDVPVVTSMSDLTKENR